MYIFFFIIGVLNNMQQPSPLVSSGASGYSTASHSYAEVTMIPVATAGPCYKECDMILPFMVRYLKEIDLILI